MSVQNEQYKKLVTIMTDPVMADHIYLLPLNTKSIRKIVQKHNIDAVLIH